MSTQTLEALFQDLRFAFRQLRKAPGFTIIVVLTLALGIGANAAIFTLVNAVLLKNLPVADPKTLVRLGDNNDCCVNQGAMDDGDYALFSTDTYDLLRKNTPDFEELAAMEAGYSYRPVTVRRDGADALARSMMGEFVSGNYFRTLGIKAFVGRVFNDADNVKGAPVNAVLSYEAWQHQYAADPSVIGSTFWVNTKAVTVVGVAPKGFFGDRLTSTPPDFYLPIESIAPLSGASFAHDPDIRWLYIVGRLKPGVAWAPVQQKVSALLRQAFAPSKMFTGKQGQADLAKAHITLAPGGAGITDLKEQYQSQLYMLMWISGAVLLIACANIANLLLVRGLGRRAELSVRTALGAKRSRVVRQLLTESVLLAVMGGCAALLVAYAGTHMLLMLAFPGAQIIPIEATPSLPVIGFATAISLVTGILFGAAPAVMAARTQPIEALRSNARTTAMRASFLQRGLVVLQAALSLVLLVGAGLFAKSLNKLQGTDMKLDTANRYIVHINPQAAGYPQTQLEALYRTMEERFHAVPGIDKVGICNYTPMEDNNWGSGIAAQEHPDKVRSVSFIKANSDYFDSVGTHIVMGRGIGIQDTSTAPRVAVVNQTFVKDYFGNRNPLGQHIGYPNSPGSFEIVGVVEDTAYTSVQWKDHRMYFLPLMQRPVDDKNPIDQDLSLYAGAIVLKTSHPMSDMESITRKTLAGINPNLTVVKFQSFSEQIDDRFTQERMIAQLTSLFGGVALLLATIGLYGVTAYTVGRRTSEIGIRMALGAQRGSVVAMVMRGAVVQAAIGLAIGIPTAIFCVKYVKSQLYEITNADPSVLAIAIAALAIAAGIAGLIPARRAAKIDPMQALRIE